MEIKVMLRIFFCLVLLAYTTVLFVAMLDTYNEDYEGKINNIRSRRGTKPFSAKFSTEFTTFKNVLHSPLIPPSHARKLHATYLNDNESDDYNDGENTFTQIVSENDVGKAGGEYNEDELKLQQKVNEINTMKGGDLTEDDIKGHLKMIENDTDNEGKDYHENDTNLSQKMNENYTLNYDKIRHNSPTLSQNGKVTLDSVDIKENGTFWEVFSTDQQSSGNPFIYGTNNDPDEIANREKWKDKHAKTNEGEMQTGTKLTENLVASETDYAEVDDIQVDSMEDFNYDWDQNQYDYRNFVKHRLFTDLFRPEYIIENDKLCGDNPYIFAFINSRVKSHKIRTAIRQSYVREFRINGISYAFIISAPQTEEDIQLLKEENDLHGDMIVTSDKEAYENLTLKTAHLLHWVNKNCLRTTYVAKVDDDVFVNVNKLMDVLAVPKNFTILGKICSSCQPNRGDDSLTLKESMHMFSNVVTRRHMPLLKLPPFAMGPAYIITRDAVEWMLEAAQYLFYFSYEDVFWTGLVVEVINKESGITFDVEKDEQKKLVEERREVERIEEEEESNRYQYKANRDEDGDNVVRRIRVDSIKDEEKGVIEKEKEEEGDIENSIKDKYLTINEEKTPKVTIKRENILNFRSDRKVNEPLIKAVITKHSLSVIIHGIHWMKDKAFVNELERMKNGK